MQAAAPPLRMTHLKETLPVVRPRRGRALVHLSIKCCLSSDFSSLHRTKHTHTAWFPFLKYVAYSWRGETHTMSNSDASWAIWWIYSLQNCLLPGVLLKWNSFLFKSGEKPPRPEVRAHSMPVKERNSPQKG